MLIFNGDQKFESFYLKHFDNFISINGSAEKTTLNDNPPINQSTGGDKESNNNEILEDK